MHLVTLISSFDHNETTLVCEIEKWWGRGVLCVRVFLNRRWLEVSPCTHFNVLHNYSCRDLKMFFPTHTKAVKYSRQNRPSLVKNASTTSMYVCVLVRMNYYIIVCVWVDAFLWRFVCVFSSVWVGQYLLCWTSPLVSVMAVVVCWHVKTYLQSNPVSTVQNQFHITTAIKNSLVGCQ